MAKTITELSDLQPDQKNANRGNARGNGLLENSLREYGAGRSILADKNGVVIAGNKTLENAAALDFPIRVIETDGTELVVVQRTDLDLVRDKRAKGLAVADNRTSEVGLTWDTEVLQELIQDGVNLDSMWHQDELHALLSQSEVPDVEFKEYDESTADDVQMCECPECGHRFPK